MNALEGIKVADFSWIVGAPLATKMLAEHGATVVRVESIKKVDNTRATPPFKDGRAGLNRSGFFNTYNDSKYGIALDLSHPKGKDIAKKLVAWADIVIENFTPGTMKHLGLGYEEVKEIKPDVIMISISMLGQNGPYARQTGLGHMLQALGGFVSLLGWPDRMPVGFQIAYNDYPAALYAVVAVIAALEYKRKTGKGQYIDMSMLESGISFLSPAVLDYGVNGREQQVNGNRCPYAAPHAAYRCLGVDRWCAIAVFTDEEWQALCKAMGQPEWSSDARFTTLLGRKYNEDELDKLIEEWTCQHRAEEVMERIQQASVASGVVQNCRDLLYDPQLQHRRHFQSLEHHEIGAAVYCTPPFKLSKTPCQLKMPSPCLGEHSEYVCTHILGLSDEEFLELLSEGILA